MLTSPAGTRSGRTGQQRAMTVWVAAVLLVAWLLPEDADARRKRAPAQPPLRILSITFSPEQYVAGDGSLDIIVDVALPEGVDGSTVLEVSSLITSPSKRHLRFLWSRKPIALHFQDHAASDGAGMARGEGAAAPDRGADGRLESGSDARTRPNHVSVTLRWDGTDQNEELVSGGRFDYVVRAKLLRVEENKLRTHMLSWKKKGSMRIQPPAVRPVLGPEPPDHDAVDAAAQEDGLRGEDGPTPSP